MLTQQISAILKWSYKSVGYFRMNILETCQNDKLIETIIETNSQIGKYISCRYISTCDMQDKASLLKDARMISSEQLSNGPSCSINAFEVEILSFDQDIVSSPLITAIRVLLATTILVWHLRNQWFSLQNKPNYWFNNISQITLTVFCTFFLEQSQSNSHSLTAFSGWGCGNNHACEQWRMQEKICHVHGC